MAEEVELTLRITSEQPGEVLREIAAVRSMDRYRLIPGSTIEIHDAYFDTPEFGLGKGGYALRVRRQDGPFMLALKGRERKYGHGGVSRLEIEGPWSEEILEEAARELGHGLVKVQGFDRTDPFATLARMGFEMIQSRQTVRTLMDVLCEHAERPFGEMALDRVCYQAAGRGYLHHEIEIEAKGENSKGTVEGFAACLIRTFPGLLTPWEHNKLITGFALEELFRRGELPRTHGGDMAMPLPWYEKIEDVIGSMG